MRNLIKRAHPSALMNRRTLMQAAGLAGASFFVPSAHSAEVTPPRRIIFLIGEQGWVRRNWAMRPPDAPATLSQYADPYEHELRYTVDEDEWEFDLTGLAQEEFSMGLEPLWNFRDRLIAIDGLSLEPVSRSDEFGDGHAKGWIASMCGHPSGRPLAGPRSHAATPSVDQVIARGLRSQDVGLSDLASLEYTLINPFPFHHFIYGTRPDGSPVKLPAENNPEKAFERLFPTAATSARKSRIVDMLAGRYDAMQSKLSGEDQAKLSLHRDLLQDIQHRLDVLEASGCAPIDPYVEVDGASKAETYRSEFSYFARLMTTAMSCGLTRVGSIQIGAAPAELLGGSGDVHHNYAHPSSPKNEFDAGKLDKFHDGIEKMSQQLVVHAEMAAELAGLLDAIPEDGGTMLDNTCIVLTNELSHGGHGHDQFPIVLLGGFGGAFKTGRFIRYPRNVPHPGMRRHGRQYCGQPHTQLLVSLTQAMGVDIDDFGLSSVPGATVGLDQDIEATINLGGPLPRL